MNFPGSTKMLAPRGINVIEICFALSGLKMILVAYQGLQPGL
jgi:hypothetical protein